MKERLDMPSQDPIKAGYDEQALGIRLPSSSIAICSKDEDEERRKSDLAHASRIISYLFIANEFIPTASEICLAPVSIPCWIILVAAHSEKNFSSDHDETFDYSGKKPIPTHSYIC